MASRFDNIKLNLGCGKVQMVGYINIDIDPSLNPDIILDIGHQPLPFEDNSVDAVRAFDVLEHVNMGCQIFVIDEIYRVLKPAGQFEHFTPSTDGRGAFQDPTHRSFWNINSWYYYCPDLVNGKTFYDIKARFDVKILEDVPTGHGVIHTHGVMLADKSEVAA